MCFLKSLLDAVSVFFIENEILLLYNQGSLNHKGPPHSDAEAQPGHLLLPLVI